MRALGLEPRTHGLKGRCSTKLSTAKTNSYNLDTESPAGYVPNLDPDLAEIVGKHKDLAGIIRTWPKTPLALRAAICRMLLTE